MAYILKHAISHIKIQFPVSFKNKPEGDRQAGPTPFCMTNTASEEPFQKAAPGIWLVVVGGGCVSEIKVGPVGFTGKKGCPSVPLTQRIPMG